MNSSGHKFNTYEGRDYLYVRMISPATDETFESKALPGPDSQFDIFLVAPIIFLVQVVSKEDLAKSFANLEFGADFV